MHATENILVAVLVLAWILYRQLQARPVRERRPLLPLVLAGIGLIETIQFGQQHRVPVPAYLLLAISVATGVALGALRGRLTQVWRDSAGVLIRQGGGTTAALWVVGLLIHLGLDLSTDRLYPGADHLGSVAILLYLGLSLAAQRLVILDRADHLPGPAAVNQGG